MGCKAFTPPLVGLTRELEGKPFHLVASHNQRGDDEHVLHEIFQNGLGTAQANVSVTKSASHPGVKGITYVPYYLLFDQHGDLIHHHQGGPYHGGDGTAVLDRVRELVGGLLPIYVGKEPYERHDKLAAELAAAKKLGRTARSLAKALSDSPDDAELVRLARALELYRDRELRALESRLATEPGDVKKDLGALEKALRETPWHEPLAKAASSWFSPERTKREKAAAKELVAIEKVWNALDPVRGNGGDVLNPLDAKFRAGNAKSLAKLESRLEALAAEAGDLPAGARARELTKLLGD